MKARLGVLVSGGGRSLENLQDAIARGELDAEIALVISDREGCGALERAARLGLEQRVIRPRECADAAAFSRAVFAALDEARVEVAVLAGYLRMLAIPPDWEGRMLNIHPSLLPAFGGPGFYGERVHRAVLASGAWFTGCTVHYVTNEVDAGPILLQRCVRVAPGDTVESLAARVFAEEQIALPEALRLHLARVAASGGAPP